MEHDLRPLPVTLDAEHGNQQNGIASDHTVFSKSTTLNKVERFSFSVWGAYLWLKGIREENLPSITIVIPVASGTGNLGETIQSLLASQYRRLHVAVVGLDQDREVIGSLLEHPEIKFFKARPETTAPEAIRSVLLRSVDPVFAWLEPGDRLSADIPNRIGKMFRLSRRIGGVIVRNEGSSPDRSSSSGTACDFDFLQAQDSTFSAKIFVRRESFWAATKIFAGTDYDCNDWAVALNSARFFQIESLPSGYYRFSTRDFDVGEEQCRHIKSKVDASIWRTERFRRSIRKQVRGYFCRLARLSQHVAFRCRIIPARASTDRRVRRAELYVPPSWTENLIGFSPGETISFLGSYRWSLIGQTCMSRSVFLDRMTKILILRDATESCDNGEPSEIVATDIGSGIGQRVQTLTRGSAILLQKMSELARGHFSPDLRVSSFSASSGPQGAGREIPISKTPVDFLILSQNLNVFSCPLVVLRQAANRLLWSGSLVVGCAAFARQTLKTDCQRSAWLMQPDFQILYSQKALFSLLEVAGLKITRLITLTDEEIANLAMDPALAQRELTKLGRRFFRARANKRASGNYLLLMCQRTF